MSTIAHPVQCTIYAFCFPISPLPLYSSFSRRKSGIKNKQNLGIAFQSSFSSFLLFLFFISPLFFILFFKFDTPVGRSGDMGIV